MVDTSEDPRGGGVGNDFVQLEIRESEPLGVEISRREDGAIAVSRFTKGGQAERMSAEAMLEPEVFQDAVILGVDGVGWSAKDEANDLCKELEDGSRPKSILFGFRAGRAGSNISGAVGVHKRYGKAVELVFRKGVMGIILDKKHDSLLKVASFGEETEAIAICKGCLLDPVCFVGASILCVNGRSFQDKNGVYEALKSPQRPKSILFKLAADRPNPGSRPPVPRIETQQTQPPCPRNHMDRRASLKMREKAVFASKSMRSLEVKNYARRNDLNLSESIRQLVIEEEQENGIDEEQVDSPGDRRSGLSSLDRRSGLSQCSDKSPSMRQLEVSISEMDRLNALNEEMALNRSYSSLDSDEFESPRAAKTRPIVKVFKRLNAGSLKGRFVRRSDSGRPIDMLDAANSENEEEQAKAMDFLKKEAYEACLKAILDHLEAFISETPQCAYEDWVEELHPENAQSRRNIVAGRNIDHRFYVEESDHRRLWNEHLGEEREFVPVREYLPAGEKRQTSQCSASH